MDLLIKRITVEVVKDRSKQYRQTDYKALERQDGLCKWDKNGGRSDVILGIILGEIKQKFWLQMGPNLQSSTCSQVFRFPHTLKCVPLGKMNISFSPT